MVVNTQVLRPFRGLVNFSLKYMPSGTSMVTGHSRTLSVCHEVNGQLTKLEVLGVRRCMVPTATRCAKISARGVGTASLCPLSAAVHVWDESLVFSRSDLLPVSESDGSGKVSSDESA